MITNYYKTSLIFALFSIVFLQGANAQEISKSLISTGGGHHIGEATGSSLHWSLGDLAAAQFTNTSTITQGFHQLFPLADPVFELPDHGIKITVHPNPFSEVITITQDEEKEYLITICDLLGRRLKTESFRTRIMEIDLRDLSDQSLFMTISSPQLTHSFKLIKSSF